VKRSKKIWLCAIVAVILAIAAYVGYMCVHYFFYSDYKKFLKEETYEEGKEFKARSDAQKKVPGMVLVTENDTLMLYTNTETTEIAVYDKRNGEITYSNPLDRANDAVATGANKSVLNSQFVLNYYDSSMTEVSINNFDMSVSLGQFSMEGIENGVRYTYVLGNLASPTGIVPPYIKADRLQELVLSKVSEKQAKSVKNSYMESKTMDGFLELTKGAKASKIGLGKLEKIFNEAGYTQENFDEDAASAGGEGKERVSFTIPLEYRLTEDSLEVSIPTSHIKETGNAYLSSIEVLRYLGAGSMEESGYMLVPNGSGSLINFNNGKKTDKYNQCIYGMDPLSQSYSVVEKTVPARLPVFGIKHDKEAIFARITRGEALTNLIADVSGNLNSYNYVYPSFELRGYEKVSMFGASGVAADLPTVEKNMYQLNLTVSYSFLAGENANYSGMANYYREELIADGVLAKKEESEELPFYLDLVGGVKLEDSRLGVPYRKVHAMTTYEEAEKIVDAFNKEGLMNLRVNYLGWFNGGYYHDVPDKIKLVKCLGDEDDLSSLTKKLEAAGSKLYGDVAFQKVTFLSKRFNYKMESSMYYSGYVVSLGKVNPATLRQTSGLSYEEALYDVLSPKYLVRYVDKFADQIDSVDLSGVSLRDLGDMLASDKRRSNVISRDQAQQVVEGQLKILEDSTDNLLVNGGNDYSFAYANDLVNVPTTHNSFYIVDEEVPFYEMVVHGCIDYTGTAINLSNGYDRSEILLRMLEFGSAPHFTLSYKDSSDIKYSGLNNFYSTQYELWLDDATGVYKEANDVLKYVTNSTIVKHEILSPGVKRITYDNGNEIYINTNTTDYNGNGVSIPAKGYVRKEVNG
jgi:hypothetical protein